jgi:23S rRNA (guanosine2251-2'-O)-methyltransferase
MPAADKDEKLSRLVQHCFAMGGSLENYQIVHAHLQYHHANLWSPQEIDELQVQDRDRTQYESGHHAIYLICENLRSAWNVGSILRVADCLGLRKVYLCGYTPKPGQHAEISSTALGADLSELWESRLDAREILQELKQQAIPCYGLETAKAAKDLLLEQPRLPLALVLGNERWGVLPSTMQRLDGLYQLPTFGKKNSLNVAVAAGAALYAIIKPTTVLP